MRALDLPAASVGHLADDLAAEYGVRAFRRIGDRRGAGRVDMAARSVGTVATSTIRAATRGKPSDSDEDHRR